MMTINSVITVLMALGMSFEDADTAVDMYLTFCGNDDFELSDIKAMWWLHVNHIDEVQYTTDNFYF